MLGFPHAKINIGLYITEKRNDGFHNLESCFYPIGWSDVLEIIPSENSHLEITGLEVDGDTSNNLCIKALSLLSKDFAISNTSVFLHKVIPMGAGLGGGSADAAFTIKLINQVYQLGLSVAQMQDYARMLGSDCAFFIESKPVYCHEKGDKFKDISLSLKGKYLVLVYPNIHISTKEAYAGVKPKLLDFDLKNFLETSPLEKWKNVIKNDFETHLFEKYSKLKEIKEYLYNQGALYASMSGSGSTIYGFFEEKPQLKFDNSYAVWQETLK
ncbi:MAG: 4-(cytidine 5'-diphospho)-2-C-methyl-D-erythritol kinase [Raineya sp.]|jgi:4-diphosphocytidyl-2-C-methyl-D-erythritol kinase|nr:4-(cytidine 5'-diphospho)-2-C-methyl-D-erythritol kinase [Raineya sp.]